MNKDPLLCYKKKEEQLDVLLSKDIRSELKLAKLYIHLYDEDFSAEMSFKEIKGITGLSENTLRGFLKKNNNWVDIQLYGKFEGYLYSAILS